MNDKLTEGIYNTEFFLDARDTIMESDNRIT